MIFKRAISRVNPHYHDTASLAKYLMALGLSLRGSFCIYQGEELGLPQAELAFEDLVDPYDIALYPEHVGRDGCRTPMPWMKSAPNAGFSSTNGKIWLPIPTEHVGLAVDRQEKDENSVLNTYRRFIAWRAEHPALRWGDFKFVTIDTEGVIGFTRSYEGETILCLYNTTEDARSLTHDQSVQSFEEHVSHGIDVKGQKIDLDAYGYGFFKLT